ncbi:class I SAM-dependent methyltransferase [Engelhardtia mirabilis]|uniref:Cephalosporin hydroxylase n=1 Tax=Engelhardtia mirabilis TaxID=2528011 RepID=A0A518BRH2_9BACT|nr:hypothetical protein Pla133_46920 [Planctomycetes bacterium Pla133]QDV03898.1 hypothetical protein Pla86_46900 [Planctomycetes bacterium Pla86]
MTTQAELARMAPPETANEPLFTDPDLAAFAEYLQTYSAAEGWFAIESAAIWDSLLAFQERRNWGGHLLEVGVYKGKSAALMAKRAKSSEHVWLIDRFLRRSDVQRTLAEVIEPADPRLHLENFDSFQLQRHPGLVDQFGKFRFLHIDGEHSAAAVQEDLAMAHAYGSRECLVSVDDILSWTYPQLTESLFRYLREHPDHFSLVLIGFNKAYLARPAYAHEYLKYCREDLIGRLERIGIDAQLSKSSYPAELNAFGIGPRHDGQAYRGLDHDNSIILY